MNIFNHEEYIQNSIKSFIEILIGGLILVYVEDGRWFSFYLLVFIVIVVCDWRGAYRPNFVICKSRTKRVIFR